MKKIAVISFIFLGIFMVYFGQNGAADEKDAARVPLVIAGPGVKAVGATTRTPAEMLDFYPTLAEMCGLKPPSYLSGVSLAPALADPKAMPRDAALTQYASGYSIRTVRYRYTEWGEQGAGGAELYDHQADSVEMVNLAGSEKHAATVAELSRLLRERVTIAQTRPEGLEQIIFENRRRVR